MALPSLNDLRKMDNCISKPTHVCKTGMHYLKLLLQQKQDIAKLITSYKNKYETRWDSIAYMSAVISGDDLTVKPEQIEVEQNPFYLTPPDRYRFWQQPQTRWKLSYRIKIAFEWKRMCVESAKLSYLDSIISDLVQTYPDAFIESDPTIMQWEDTECYAGSGRRTMETSVTLKFEKYLDPAELNTEQVECKNIDEYLQEIIV